MSEESSDWTITTSVAVLMPHISNSKDEIGDVQTTKVSCATAVQEMHVFRRLRRVGSTLSVLNVATVNERRAQPQMKVTYYFC